MGKIATIDDCRDLGITWPNGEGHRCPPKQQIVSMGGGVSFKGVLYADNQLVELENISYDPYNEISTSSLTVDASALPTTATPEITDVYFGGKGVLADGSTIETIDGHYGLTNGYVGGFGQTLFMKLPITQNAIQLTDILIRLQMNNANSTDTLRITVMINYPSYASCNGSGHNNETLTLKLSQPVWIDISDKVGMSMTISR